MQMTKDANEVPSQISTVPVESDPPDGGFGWVQVGVAFTINCFTWGQTAVCDNNYFICS
jgi:hypothetical protein